MTRLMKGVGECGKLNSHILSEIVLGCLKISANGWKSLAKCLPYMENLIIFSANYCELDHSGLIELYSPLKVHKSIRTLDFSHNYLNDKAALIISKIVAN